MLATKKILFLFAQIFFCVVCFAQREKIDSLKKILPSLHDSARVDCLNELSETYLKFYNVIATHFIPDTPKYYADSAYEIPKNKLYPWHRGIVII